MEEEIIPGNKILLSKRYTTGSVFLLESPTRLLVVAFDNNHGIICSRCFFYTDPLKKQARFSAKKYFRSVQWHLMKRKLDTIEEIDFEQREG